MATAGTYARRRRNALLAAVALAVVLILVIVLIIVGISKRKGGGSANKATPTPTNNLILPTATPTPTIPVVTATTPPATTPDESPTAPGSADGSRTMYVTGDGVNVRKEASTGSDVVTSLAKGTAVTAYEQTGDFTRIKLANGTTGFMASKYLSTTRPATTSPTAPSSTPDTSKPTTMYVNGDKVNVREAASASSKSVTRLAKGTKITAYASVTANGMKWTYIEYAKDKYGYIASQYLSETAVSSVTPTPTPTGSGSATPTPAHATSSADFLPADIAAKFTPTASLLNQTKAKMGTLVNVKEGYTVYEVEKTNGTYYYVALKDGAAAAYPYDSTDQIGK